MKEELDKLVIQSENQPTPSIFVKKIRANLKKNKTIKATKEENNSDLIDQIVDKAWMKDLEHRLY